MGGHETVGKTKYHTIDDIPDELIPTSSKRDPDNMLYKTRRWVNFKKRQILYQQNDGVPYYLRTRNSRIMYYALWASTVGMFFFNIYTYNRLASKKKN